jgi:hypothetical protein
MNSFRPHVSALAAVAVVVAGCSDSVRLPAARSAWGNELSAGPFGVGFRTIELSRNPAEGSARRLTLSLWFPAQTVAGDTRVTLGDLYELVLAESQLDEPRGSSFERGFVAAMTGDSLSIPAEVAREALDSPTLASADPEPAEGRFPLVLWGVRHATTVAQAPLSELLASHGFVVATVWSSDPPLAFLWEDRPEEEKQATIDAHAEDLLHALSVLRTEPFVDGSRIVAMAWSYGGSTAYRLAMADDAVRAVVALDANVLAPGSADLVRPLVWLARPEAADPGLPFTGAAAPWLTVRLPELAHGNFNALEGWLPSRYEARSLFPWSFGGPIGVVSYPAVARMAIEAARLAVAGPGLPISELAGRLESAAGGLTVGIATGRP